MDIPLDPRWEAFIAEQIASGAYASAEEVITAGLGRLATEGDILAGWDIEELRAEIQIGIDQIERGEYTEVAAEDLSDYLAKLRERAKQHVAEKSK